MKTHGKKKGFTIVELLTVMAIIALLLSILTPALNIVRRIAKDTAQRAQFHIIDVAMESYCGDIGEYPESTALPSTNRIPTAGGSNFTVGAMHLAEALVGRDLIGLDPLTSWDAYADQSRDIYGRGAAIDVNNSLDRRKGPYLEPQNAGAYEIQKLYDVPGNVYVDDTNFAPAPVLTDIYAAKTVSQPGVKQIRAGSPILYYKANVSTKTFYSPKAGDIYDSMAASSIFNSQDNEELLELGALTDSAKEHHFRKAYLSTYGGRNNFYDTITNPTITTQVRPYNQTSYILMSAGFDGIFGTPDDVYNFKN